jgi:hypothetical protein
MQKPLCDQDWFIEWLELAKLPVSDFWDKSIESKMSEWTSPIGNGLAP